MSGTDRVSLLRVGSLLIQPVSDGVLSLDPSDIFAEADPDQWRSRVQLDARGRVDLALTCLLVQSGDTLHNWCNMFAECITIFDAFRLEEAAAQHLCHILFQYGLHRLFCFPLEDRTASIRSQLSGTAVPIAEQDVTVHLSTRLERHGCRRSGRRGARPAYL